MHWGCTWEQNNHRYKINFALLLIFVNTSKQHRTENFKPFKINFNSCLNTSESKYLSISWFDMNDFLNFIGDTI